MADAALHFGSFLGMWKFLDRAMAIATAKDSVDAGCESLWADGDVFACFGFHAGLAVTGETRLVSFCNNPMRGCAPGEG